MPPRSSHAPPRPRDVRPRTAGGSEGVQRELDELLRRSLRGQPHRGSGRDTLNGGPSPVKARRTAGTPAPRAAEKPLVTSRRIRPHAPVFRGWRAFSIAPRRRRRLPTPRSHSRPFSTFDTSMPSRSSAPISAPRSGANAQARRSRRRRRGRERRASHHGVHSRVLPLRLQSAAERAPRRAAARTPGAEQHFRAATRPPAVLGTRICATTPQGAGERRANLRRRSAGTRR